MRDFVYRASRPAEVWLCINNISRGISVRTGSAPLPDEAMIIIHEWVRKLHSGENAGHCAFVDMKDREAAAIRNARAEPPVSKYELLGFRTFAGFQAHVQQEERLAEARRLEQMQSSMAEWQKFGFPSRRAYNRHRRQLPTREI